MYGYYKYGALSKEEILSRVSQEDIFKIVIKEDIVLDKGALYRAPYRDDSHADCYFEEYDSTLYFKDHGDSEGKWAKDCFNIIERTYNLNHYESLRYISNYLGLEASDSPKEEVVRNTVEVLQKSEKKKKTITFTPRLFNHKDKNFWKKYEISRQNLIDDKVVPISIYRSTSKRDKPFTIKPFDVMYAYTDFPEGRVKIYRPNSPIKEGKWFTNTNQNDIGCINSLPERGDMLVITKSYKDCRVLRNQGLNSVWIQSEAVIPADSILMDLCKRFKRIVIWFDNDQTGLAKAKLFKDHINSLCKDKAITVFLPPKLFREEDIKDPSDYLASKGRQALIVFLIEKQLLHES